MYNFVWEMDRQIINYNIINSNCCNRSINYMIVKSEVIYFGFWLFKEVSKEYFE